MSEELKKAHFRVATLNVHGWEDASGYDNVDRIVELVKVIILLCIQRITDLTNGFSLLKSRTFVLEFVMYFDFRDRGGL